MRSRVNLLQVPAASLTWGPKVSSGWIVAIVDSAPALESLVPGRVDLNTTGAPH